MTDHPLSAVELETKLDQSLDPALSARRTTHLAEALASFARGEQEFVLRWTDIIARTNTEMAYLFASQAPHGARGHRGVDRAGDGRVRPHGPVPGVQSISGSYRLRRRGARQCLRRYL